MTASLLRDPLAHFLLAGAAIWGVLALVGDPVDPASRTIDLTRERQAGIALGFERMMGRPPTDTEMDAAIARWVREEVLYREALRLGLDEGDAVVRRRLSTKMDELAGAEAEMAQPSDQVLAEWLSTHADAYREDGAVSFEQAYFAGEQAARAALASGNRSGERIGLPRSATKMSLKAVAQTFGQGFAAQLAQSAPGAEWQGPIRSGYGWHLVRLAAREEGSVPPLAEIRDRILTDWRSATIAERRERAYELLREAYRVEVE